MVSSLLKRFLLCLLMCAVGRTGLAGRAGECQQKGGRTFPFANGLTGSAQRWRKTALGDDKASSARL